jgi:hypothetical protein
MATALSKVWTTRDRYRADLEAALFEIILAGQMGAHETFDPPLDLDEGEAPVPVVTIAHLRDSLRDLFREELPPPSERSAEIRTPGMLTVWAKCPNCGIHMVIPLQVTPQLVLDDGVGELKLKAKSKGRIHACGQLTIENPDGQMAFAPDADGEGSETEDVSEPAGDDGVMPQSVTPEGDSDVAPVDQPKGSEPE